MEKKTEKVLVTGCLLAALAVATGAFGAHGLEPMLEKNGTADTFETAVQYHILHTIGILVCGILMNFRTNSWLRRSFLAMLSGIILFSGSLYVLAVTNLKVLGMITPVGGVLFMLGWVFLAAGVVSRRQ